MLKCTYNYKVIEMELKDLSGLLKTVSHEKRLRILALLKEFDQKICVCEFVDALEMPQYQVSQHLRELRGEDIVEGERRGTWVYYSLSKSMPEEARSVVDSLTSNVEKEAIEEDIKRLNQRIARRENGKCVVGYEEE